MKWPMSVAVCPNQGSKKNNVNDEASQYKDLQKVKLWS